MTIYITIPYAVGVWQLRRLLAIICLFAPNATVRIGNHIEQTLPSQVAAVPGLDGERVGRFEDYRDCEGMEDVQS